jgi:hypothetical protein
MVTLTEVTQGDITLKMTFKIVSQLLLLKLHKNISHYATVYNGLCGLVPGYRFKDPGFDSRRYQIF